MIPQIPQKLMSEAERFLPDDLVSICIYFNPSPEPPKFYVTVWGNPDRGELMTFEDFDPCKIADELNSVKL